MKTDSEVHRMIRERNKGKTLDQAAARAGMSVPTARKYLRAGKLPSQLKQPRSYRTRPDPFADDWPWVQAHLERDSAIQAQTLFALLCEQHPGRYQAGQLRTLQRRIAAWRALHGPDQEVIFEQVHQPGRMAQSDFTHMTELRVTLGGIPFPHLIYHLVLTYSNIEAIQICFSESFEALAEGLEACLWHLGGVPQLHRTDNLSAAVHVLQRSGRKQFTERYLALLEHYGMQPTTNNVGIAHENGDVEQAHFRFKQAVDQALRIRGSRDFADRAAYTLFLQEVVRKRNRTRQTRWDTERAALRPLPALPLAPCRELQVKVSRFSTIRVFHNVYSVPSRLIGTLLTVRVRAEVLDLSVGTRLTLSVPRLHGRGQQQIDYRHLIWSLLRKPSAFAEYRYRDEFFPSLLFRQAYERLQAAIPQQADREYLRVLHLAASLSESEVELALSLVLESGTLPTSEEVRVLVEAPRPLVVPEVSPVVLDLRPYEQLLMQSEVAG